jgi:hypothetical protein
MAETGRMFLCARCRAQVLLCSRCDRGQRYCSRLCAGAARRAAQRAAAERYQSSRAGRFAHAARARRYRALHKFVTHQGSVTAPADALLALQTGVPSAGAVGVPSQTTAVSGRCTACGARCAAAVRSGFLRHRRPTGDRSILAHRSSA